MSDGDPGYDALVRDGVLRIARPGTEWLSTGANGGRVRADCAYNLSVPEGWNRTDLAAYVTERLERAGFLADSRRTDAARGPALLTGVDVAHARGARCGPVTAYATVGLSNPAALPMDPPGGSLPDETDTADGDPDAADGDSSPVGTVNVLVGTTRSLPDGALANLVAVAAEAKAATLLARTGFPGTTTDAVVAGHDPDGTPAAFSGSATPVGAAARACVREAVTASLEARYDDTSIPDSVEEATYGVSTDARARVFRPDRSE
ncbi:adenosylcobinamide amidohydrolase [Halopiger goleimassiliensis]|uniref:adenosylcobinamide amidohydrolase n=1 Tax=Halopiger goleimassiliensis TaxID=1293048 RepID=UPI000677694B|nr:adenosylcobinamide amidohydrolase [Halopiger goleimassiliensis]